MAWLYQGEAGLPTKLREVRFRTAHHTIGIADRNRFCDDVGLAHDLPYQCRDPASRKPVPNAVRIRDKIQSRS
jgi:hypothetical protein